MPKQKTKRAAMKRFWKLTGSGKIKRARANKRHILTKKTTKREEPAREVCPRQFLRIIGARSSCCGRHKGETMPRVTNGLRASCAQEEEIMEAAKGGFQARSKLYKAAKENVERGLAYAYRDRRKKKGDFRRLWITRIGAAARLHEISYSRLMAGLRVAGIEINRKVLADLAVRDADAFAKLAEVAKAHQG